MPRTDAERVRGRVALAFVVFTIAATLLLLGLLELAARVALPFANRQGTDSSLLRLAGVGESVGWVPGARGTSFDADFEIDERGFRRLGVPSTARESLVLLGDSVTAGVGVGAERTFAARLQESLPDLRVVDTAVIGYSIDDYVTVLRELVASGEPIRRVIVFVCLNDVAERMTPEVAETPLARVRFWLRDGSVLYQWLKGVLTDRSLAHYRDIAPRHVPGNPGFERLAAGLGELARIAERAGFPLGVVIFPYEAQLRGSEPDAFAPQRRLVARLGELGVPTLDLSSRFASAEVPAVELFLWKDAMHLSEAGHLLTAQAVSEWLAREARSE